MRLCSLGNSSIATEHRFSVTATEHGSRWIPAGRLHYQEITTHLANQFCPKTIHPKTRERGGREVEKDRGREKGRESDRERETARERDRHREQHTHRRSHLGPSPFDSSHFGSSHFSPRFSNCSLFCIAVLIYMPWYAHRGTQSGSDEVDEPTPEPRVTRRIGRVLLSRTAQTLFCDRCGAGVAQMRNWCPCLEAKYCSVRCQNGDWAKHSQTCPWKGYNKVMRLLLATFPKEVVPTILAFVGDGHDEQD